jgi:tripartite-type tricarboxylate transporter receptor subunit TctC
MLVLHPSVPAKSVKELIALAKSRPGQLNFASGGAGTTTHLASELFKLSAGLNIVHVPYKGTGQALTDLIGGQVQMMMSSMLPAMPHVKAARLRALAVTSARRATVLPDMPTMAESGVPGFETTSWHGMLVPAKTPTAIVARLHAELVKTLNQPDVKERFANQGMDVVASTPQAFTAYITSESAKWSHVIKTIGIKPQ